MLNGILSIVFIVGLLNGSILLIVYIGVFGKLGIFPFTLIVLSLIYNSSFYYLFIDTLNKWVYYSLLEVHCFNYWLIVLHFIFIIFLLSSISSIKQLIVLSSIISFLLIIMFIMMLLKKTNRIVERYLFYFH